MSPRLARGAARLASAGLALLAVLHLVWIATPWPWRDRTEFARHVIGEADPARAPGAGATLAVALLLFAAAALVAIRADAGHRWSSARLTRLGHLIVVLTLTARGALGLLLVHVLGADGLTPEFVALDGRWYSPLALALGLLAASAARARAV